MGILQRHDTGRPEVAYGRNANHLEHEVIVTEVAIYFHDAEISRDANVGETTADLFMLHRGKRCYIEVDCSGKMTVKTQMQKKWMKYQTMEKSAFILVVALTERRMERLRKSADAVKSVAFFTTLSRLQSDMKEPWIDFFGKTLRI